MADLRSQLQSQAYALSLRRQARPQAQIAQRNGTGVVVNGQTLRANRVTNEPLGTGDAVVVSGASGVGQQERRKTKRGEAVSELSNKILRVKILTKVTTSSKIEFWIGGHTKTPFLVKDFLLSFGDTLGSLENTGRGKKDYIFAYKTTPGVHTPGVTPIEIGVIYGARPQDSWSLTDPRNHYLNYAGNGFWNSAPQFLYLNDEYKSTQTNTQPLDIGYWACTDRGLFSCKEYSLTGPISGEGFTRTLQAGLPDRLSGTLFASASNTKVSISSEMKFWDGNWAGANEPEFSEYYLNNIYLGEKCLISAFTWQEHTNGLLIARYSNELTRTLSSTGFTFAANASAISQFAGPHNINYAASRINQPEVTSKVLQPHAFEPIAIQGSIGIEGLGTGQCAFFYRQRFGENRTSPAVVESSLSYNLNQSIQIPVSPNRLQGHSLSIFQLGDVFRFEIDTVERARNFKGGFLYQKTVGDGTASISPIRDLPILTYQNSVSNWVLSYEQSDFVFQEIPSEGLPKVLDSEVFPCFAFVAPPENDENALVFVEAYQAIVKIFRKVGTSFQNDDDAEKRPEKVYAIPLPQGRKEIAGVDYF